MTQPIIYEHTQPGSTMLILIGIPLVILIPTAPLPPGLIVIAILATVMVIFHSLTVRVDAEQVRLHFGPGAFRRAFPVQQIRAARVVRAPLWYGLGIHFIPGGVAYNVSGRGAVELQMENGRRAVIGSDEPEALLAAIEEVL